MNKNKRYGKDGITILTTIGVCVTLVVAITILSVVTGAGKESVIEPATSATPLAQDFDLKDLSGKRVKLSDYKGKVVAVNFWATWCGPCRAEIPDFIKLREQYNSRGLEIIGISLDRGGPQAVANFAERFKINYPVVMGDQKTVDAYGPINAIPTTFVVDRQGRIHSRHLGLVSFNKIENTIKPLL